MKASDAKLQELLQGGVGSLSSSSDTCASRIIFRDSNIFRDMSSRDFDVLAVGMNCHNAMGVGVLRTLAERFPQFAEADKATGKGKPTKLGTVTTSDADKGVKLAALYIQFGYGNFKLKNHYSQETGHINLDHFESALRELLTMFPKKRVALAQPGVGNNGTPMAKLLPVIEKVLNDMERTLIFYTSNPKKSGKFQKERKPVKKD